MCGCTYDYVCPHCAERTRWLEGLVTVEVANALVTAIDPVFMEPILKRKELNSD